MATKPDPLHLTRAERNALIMCLSGEVENDDGHHDQYMVALRRILRKLQPPDRR